MTLNNVNIAKWSVSEYHRMIAAGILSERQVELLAGEIIEMSPEGPLHTIYGEGLANYLRMRLSTRAWIREARPITLCDSEPEPDIAVVKLPWFQYSEHHPYPDDIFLVIEISDSTLRKDLNEKQTIYGKAGILEYWVLDIKLRKMIIFREPHLTGYHQKQEFSHGNINTLTFPDVAISLEKVFSGQIFNQ